MSERQVLGRSPLHWAIVLGVSLGISLGVAEFVMIDIQSIMPDYSMTETLLFWGLLALIGFIWLEIRALRERATVLESEGRNE